MIRAVLDTNVLASGIVGIRHPSSTPGELLRRWRQGAFSLIISGHILNELERTLAKPYFASRITGGQIAQIIWALRHQGEVTDISTSVAGVATHPEDDLVLATAASAQANFLVTGDSAMLAVRQFGTASIVTPAAFLAIFDATLQLPEGLE